MKYSLFILKNKKSLQKTQISFPKNIEHQIFLDPQLQLLRVFGYHLTIQSLISRKRYAQKASGCGTEIIPDFQREMIIDISIKHSYLSHTTLVTD